MELNQKSYEFYDFNKRINDVVNIDLKYLSEKYNRKFVIQQSNQNIKGYISVDTTYFEKIVKELFVNAIKYSPDGSDIILQIEKNLYFDINNGKNIDIVLKNTPKKMNAKDLDGIDIIGIPYEYSELVFDLFYTIDPFPNEFEDEEWNNGTGLYIARKILKRQNGWIKTSNGVDYTKGTPEPYIKFVITLPYN